jgi:hypothetical protein
MAILKLERMTFHFSLRHSTLALIGHRICLALTVNFGNCAAESSTPVHLHSSTTHIRKDGHRIDGPERASLSKATAYLHKPESQSKEHEGGKTVV